MKKGIIRTAINLSVILMVICFLRTEREGEGTSDGSGARLENYRTDYIGDAPKVVGIVSNLPRILHLNI